MDLYKTLDVKTYINAHDTCTAYGGSRMEESTRKAMWEAANWFVDLDELQDKLGKEIAQMTHNEGAYITSGASAGLLLASVVVLAGDNAQHFQELPQGAVSGKNEFVFPRGQNNPFLSAVVAAGGKLVPAGTAQEMSICQLERAFTEKTACVLYFAADYHAKKAPPLSRIIEAAHARGIPVVVDAAAQLPPVENLWAFTRAGADMVIFSGGKGLKGPQCSGFIFGTADMIERCKKYGSPVHGICRSSKIGKEEMVGLYTALCNFMALDWESEKKRLLQMSYRLAQAMDKTGAMKGIVLKEGPAGQDFPIAFGEITDGGDPQRIQAAFRKCGIFVGVRENGILINPYNLTEQELEHVIASFEAAVRSAKQK